ncbi:DNA polymerase IV [Adlercreutzia murintestinalis]|uniref:DNA polymerase IV n=1 Tax=Adlercreutzia murintestinalis TaxID=2941325 RepID=UPI00203F0FDE|nr:DNA polymerase IV [Adlercreutzia murintestinalis]
MNDSNASVVLPAWHAPAILLVDLDAFFASVEQLDHPEWRGKPVIVGGDADSRGVVATCSYEARRFGVRSAMPAAQAQRLCPQAIWTHGRHARYSEVSRAIMALLRDETPLVEQVSIDEAFLDVSPTRVNTEHPVRIAQRIQDAVDGLGVSCSIGVGTSKAIAKIASDMDKPHGLTVVYPGSERTFLGPLPIRTLSGIGPAAEKRLMRFGIATLSDLAEADEGALRSVFGKNASLMRRRALGENDSAVQTERATKSVSKEMTFARDLTTWDDIHAALRTLSTQVGRRLRRAHLAGTTVTVKVRYGNWETHSVQTQLPRPTDHEADFIEEVCRMVRTVWNEGVPVRLLGVGISRFEGAEPQQTSLFADEHAHQQSARWHDLASATDSLKDRFGEDAVRFGHELRSTTKTTGTQSKTITNSGEISPN